MPELSLQRRLAADILKVGQHRVWLDPNALDKIESAITRKDLQELINQGIIKRKPQKAQSRARARKLEIAKSKGRRKGAGSRKGARGARANPKQLWMSQVRALRRRLKLLRDRGMITSSSYRKLYKLVKGGGIRSVAQLTEQLKQHGMLISRHG